MKATSRLTTYPIIGMIQRWKRDKSTNDQNFPAGVFPFVFQETSDNDFCHRNYVPSNLSSQLVEACEKNNISKHQRDPTVDYRDMATGALLVSSNSAFSLVEFSIVSHPLFFFELVAFCFFKGTFPLITFMSLIYVFKYFILFFI
jgi:hypothetical protein